MVTFGSNARLLKKLLLYIICLYTLGHSGLYAQNLQIQPSRIAIQAGDDYRWKNPEFDDSAWTQETLYYIGNLWMRYELTCGEDCRSFINPGLRVISMGAYELYWDGTKIAESGKVGLNKEEEIPGKLLSQVMIADSLLSPGVHKLAMRVSNYYTPLPVESWNTLYLEEYGASQNRELRVVAIMFILGGIYLMAAIYFSWLYFLRKREREGLIFSILCVLFFLLILLEYLKFFISYTYDYHILRVFGIYSLTFAISFLTPYFFIHFFDLPRKNTLIYSILLLLILLSIPFVPGTDYTNRLLTLTTWLTSTGVVTYALVKRRKESGLIYAALIISGLIVSFANVGFQYLLYSYDITIFVSFSLLVLSMMYVLVRRAREQRDAYEASLVLSARLQTELLKKNIQPHFIMNTLTSLMGWIEESPKESIHFIEALSKEFEIMSDIAEKKLIPITQEIDLCKYHIEIMKYRKEIEYVFEQKGIDPDEQVPPAIFHTLIENGITHSKIPPNGRMVFELAFYRIDAQKVYQLITKAPNKHTDQVREGTGLKYIKSRLTENYGEKWELESYAIEGGWQTKITLEN